MPEYRFVQFDVFTDRAFGGNPLAVFPEAEGISDEHMMQIAREMNLSETVFVLKPENKFTGPDGTPDNQTVATQEVLRKLRIFTPVREIPFAGHPIVGTWTALAQQDVVPVPDGGNGWARIFYERGMGGFAGVRGGD